MNRDMEGMLSLLQNMLIKALGSNLELLVLYGSRARGDEEPDSDMDLLVVLKNVNQGDREKIHRIAYNLMWEREFQPLISLNIIDREHYTLLSEAGSSYLGNILREGKPLWLASETKADVG